MTGFDRYQVNLEQLIIRSDSGTNSDQTNSGQILSECGKIKEIITHIKTRATSQLVSQSVSQRPQTSAAQLDHPRNLIHCFFVPRHKSLNKNLDPVCNPDPDRNPDHPHNPMDSHLA